MFCQVLSRFNDPGGEQFWYACSRHKMLAATNQWEEPTPSNLEGDIQKVNKKRLSSAATVLNCQPSITLDIRKGAGWSFIWYI